MSKNKPKHVIPTDRIEGELAARAKSYDAGCQRHGGSTQTRAETLRLLTTFFRLAALANLVPGKAMDKAIGVKLGRTCAWYRCPPSFLFGRNRRIIESRVAYWTREHVQDHVQNTEIHQQMVLLDAPGHGAEEGQKADLALIAADQLRQYVTDCRRLLGLTGVNTPIRTGIENAVRAHEATQRELDELRREVEALRERAKAPTVTLEWIQTVTERDRQLWVVYDTCRKLDVNAPAEATTRFGSTCPDQYPSTCVIEHTKVRRHTLGLYVPIPDGATYVAVEIGNTDEEGGEPC
jgi:hypothetical protein